MKQFGCQSAVSRVVIGIFGLRSKNFWDRIPMFDRDGLKERSEMLCRGVLERRMGVVEVDRFEVGCAAGEKDACVAALDDFAGIGAAKEDRLGEFVSTESKHQQDNSLRPVEPLQGALVND